MKAETRAAQAAAELRQIKKPAGQVPTGKLTGEVGAAETAMEAKGAVPRRSTSIYPADVLALERERLLRGEISLADYAQRFPAEGASEVFLPTAYGGRYIDHMYVEGGQVVLRESKNVANFRLLEEYRSQLDKDLNIQGLPRGPR